ncbi:hypothetical protein A9Q84_10380 [Halobacteriovorax marinus]|uniref:Uncharacterized protein n=1 Tax=Halobacteriovorax marinus TaxID=97084 RepID=A0A1Y5F757_9BACT|nr:hypothetical protein A9Q84_10380 [Halobacteriovorax marinus]
MIVLFVGGHLVLVHSITGQIDVLKSALVFMAIFLFFFKMRLYDEIKDYDLDCEINPTRPLPRGLLNLTDMKKGIFACIALELILFSTLGVNAIFSLVFAILYSLLMYKEFFIPKLIRPHLTTYAVVHTVVTVPMGLSIFSAMTGKLPWLMENSYYQFVLCSWFVFNIFEFGRKTFTTAEERNAVESYSKIFTRYGAVALVISMSLLSLYMLFKIQNGLSYAQLILSVILAMIGIVFSIKNKEKLGKIYRGFSSGYIILFYILFIIEINLGLLL